MTFLAEVFWPLWPLGLDLVGGIRRFETVSLAPVRESYIVTMEHL